MSFDHSKYEIMVTMASGRQHLLNWENTGMNYKEFVNHILSTALFEQDGLSIRTSYIESIEPAYGRTPNK